MQSSVCAYCFNRPFLDGDITVPESIAFVGDETEAHYYEPLSRYWDPNRDELEQAREAADIMREHGLSAFCYTMDSDFAVYDDRKHQQCIDQSVARLEVARALGAATIRLDPRTSLPGKPEDADLLDILERIASGMQAVTDEAAKADIVVGVENHGRLVGRTEQTARLVERVDRPNFGVNIDFTNFRVVFGEDHVESTRRLAPHVVHAHAKDILLSREPMPESEGWHQIPSGEWSKNTVGGAGDADWPTLFGLLRDAGYEGAISLESVDPADIKGSITTGVANINKTIAGL